MSEPNPATKLEPDSKKYVERGDALDLQEYPSNGSLYFSEG